MASILRMPEVAANAVEAVLQSWPVAENAAYAADDVIATVETEKAVVDVEADKAGVILKTLVAEGAEVQVGDPIAVIGEPGEKAGDLDALLAGLGVPAAGPAAAPDLPEADAAAASVASAASGNGSGERVFSSPLARRLAKEAGLPFETISGTGPNGRIIRRDVEAAISSRVTSPQAAAPRRPDPAAESADAPKTAARTAAPAFTDVPHSRIRSAVASRLTESKRTTPHFYLRGTARVGRLLKLRRRLNEGPVRISLNDLVLKAAAQAHVLVPAMNVIWTPDAVRSFSSVDISVAIATERGLVTPVLRSAEQLTISSVATTVRDFVERARAGRLRQEELEGGSFSVTNLGMLGTEEFAAIINPPQSAILAVGAVREEPVVKEGTLKVGSVMRVTLSVDHRPIDGAIAAEWMKVFISLLEDPVRILA
ncbi:pyruvate dehydrogenase complex dihydrolipoamide acetyltransferase [Actinoallomurus bryophytorum]|uniref:Dihydrolipoamide acetyltransferase component of pyruvate dehydrogenase complex n=1 Tax=Actinoallomurus bryophytorum TaxID=1490222 RepID=A0A543CV92_9ACTN|nr:dihydrolipoamide acetyltransferase family protein [Actinoallomurus bryophytorum]TQM01023.1 pyruvate dehydrogenase E2 component (dihydrolipoamide acetyltransferase) [Actinoallomurus bryophytorum]